MNAKNTRAITIDDNLIFTAGKIRKINDHETNTARHTSFVLLMLWRIMREKIT